MDGTMFRVYNSLNKSNRATQSKRKAGKQHENTFKQCNS